MSREAGSRKRPPATLTLCLLRVPLLSQSPACAIHGFGVRRNAPNPCAAKIKPEASPETPGLPSNAIAVPVPTASSACGAKPRVQGV